MNSIVPPPRRTQDLPSFVIQTVHYHKKYDDESTDKLTGRIEIYSSSFNQRFEFISDRDVLVVPINTLSEKNSTQITRNRPKIRINLKNKDNFVFEMVEDESRDSFREKIDTMLKIQKDIDVLSSGLRRNFTALSGNSELCKLYLSLIVRDSVLTPSEFWEGREEMMVEAREKERIPGIVSIEMQPDIFKVKNQKYVVNATSEAKKKLFLLYPSARRAFENSVPSKLSEKEFWIKFARSDYFLADETDDADVKKINKYRRMEEEKLKAEMNRQAGQPKKSFPYLALSHNDRDRSVGQSHRGRRVEERLETKDADTQKIETRNIESFKVVTWDRFGSYKEEKIENEMKSGIVDPFDSMTLSSSQNNEIQLMPVMDTGRRTNTLDLDLNEYHKIMEMTNHRRMRKREEMKKMGPKYATNFMHDLKNVQNDSNSIKQNIKISDIQNVSRELTYLTKFAGETVLQEMKAEEDIKNMNIGDSLFQDVAVVNELLRHYWRENPVIGRNNSIISEDNNNKKKKKRKKVKLEEEGETESKIERIVRKLREKHEEMENLKPNPTTKSLFDHLKDSVQKALRNHDSKMKKRNNIQRKRGCTKRGSTSSSSQNPKLNNIHLSELTNDNSNTLQKQNSFEEEEKSSRGIFGVGISLNVQDTPQEQQYLRQQQQQQQEYYLNASGTFNTSGFSPMTPPAAGGSGPIPHSGFPTSPTTSVFPGFDPNQTNFTSRSTPSTLTMPETPKGMELTGFDDVLSPLDEFNPQTFGSVNNVHHHQHHHIQQPQQQKVEDGEEEEEDVSVLGRRPRSHEEVDGLDQQRIIKKRKLD